MFEGLPGACESRLRSYAELHRDFSYPHSAFCLFFQTTIVLRLGGEPPPIPYPFLLIISSSERHVQPSLYRLSTLTLFEPAVLHLGYFRKIPWSSDLFLVVPIKAVFEGVHSEE
jgi:hypothetical protein